MTGPPPPPASLARVVRVGPVRTLEQDPAYGVRVLVDIAIRALSPAVNDPTSAVQALDHLLYGAGSLQVARRLTALLTDLRAAAPPARRQAVEVRLATLRRMVTQAMPDPVLAAAAAPHPGRVRPSGRRRP